MQNREKIEKAIDMLLVNAEFNEFFINDIEKNDDHYFGDLGDHRQSYQFYVERGFVKGKKEKMIVVGKNREGKQSFSMIIEDFSDGKREELTEDKILSDEALAEEFLQYLLGKLDSCHFKYEDIESGKVLSLQPEGSDVALHIEEYLLKLADMLSKGLHSKAYTRITCGGSGEYPMVIEFSQFGGKACFNFRFKNSLFPGGEEVKEVSVDNALSAIAPEVIEAHELEFPISKPAQHVLRGLLKLDLPQKLKGFTDGLNSAATFEDVASVIQFRANRLDISEARIMQMNEQLGDHGVVIKKEEPQLKKSS